MWYLEDEEEASGSSTVIEQLEEIRNEEDKELAGDSDTFVVPTAAVVEHSEQPQPTQPTQPTAKEVSFEPMAANFGNGSSIPSLEANLPKIGSTDMMDIDGPSFEDQRSHDAGEGDFQFNLELDGSGQSPLPKRRSALTQSLEAPSLPLVSEDFRDEYRADRHLISEFLENITCYDAMPLSGKMVVLDTNLTVKAAFQALVENDIKSAPLWDSGIYDYVGMITVTDFIDVLRNFYTHAETKGTHRIDQTPIKAWREIIAQERPPSLIHLKPDESIFKAGKMLLKFQIHRLPVIDREEQNTILYILTHTRIIKFLMANIPQKPAMLSEPIGKLGLGTSKHVVSAKESTPLISVLNMLSERKISAVPVVDEHDRLVEIYSKTDVAALAMQPALHEQFKKPIKEIIKIETEQAGHERRLCTCTFSSTLEQVLDELFVNRVRRAVILDNQRHVKGIISMSDILKFFLL